jgi:hypothetical protein
MRSGLSDVAGQPVPAASDGSLSGIWREEVCGRQVSYGMSLRNWRLPGSGISMLDEGNADRAVSWHVDEVLDSLLEESTGQRLVRTMEGPLGLPWPNAEFFYDTW